MNAHAIYQDARDKIQQDAKYQYESAMTMVSQLQGKVSDSSIKMTKAGAWIQAGIYNKNKEQYEKGKKKWLNMMYKIEDETREKSKHKICFINVDAEDKVSSSKNENAYLNVCNSLYQYKKDLDELGEMLQRTDYFNH